MLPLTNEQLDAMWKDAKRFPHITPEFVAHYLGSGLTVEGMCVAWVQDWSEAQNKRLSVRARLLSGVA